MEMETKTITINIVIDDKHYKVHSEEITGAQLKALASIPETNLLFLEVHGPGDDELIPNDMTVHLHDGDHFYDMPPGNFGWELRA